MKAAVLQDYFRFGLEEVPEPEPAPDEVKIRVVATGICGSELHAYRGTHPFRRPPSIQGHEFAGDVLALGDAVQGIRVGDRVTVEPLKSCGVCEDCLAGYPGVCAKKTTMGFPGWTGSYAQCVVCPERLVYRLPPHVSYEEGAMVEPLTVGVHAAVGAGLGPGSSVLVLGSGTIGLSTVAAAASAGASTIVSTDLFDFKLEIARKLGATAIANPLHQDVGRIVAEATDGRGVDVVMVAADDPDLLNQAIAVVKRRGLVLFIALVDAPITLRDALSLTFGERAIRGSVNYSSAEFRRALDLIASGRVDVRPLITHRMPIDQTQRAFEMVDKGLEDYIKVILKH